VSDSQLNFSDSDKCGNIIAVDTNRVLINVTDNSLVRIQVGQLIAIQGRNPVEFLIAIIEKVMRRLPPIDNSLANDDIDLTEDGSPAFEVSDSLDLVQAALVGTYRTKDGSAINTFRRGAVNAPQIDKNCYLLEKENLQKFMGILTQDIPEEQKLKLGSFAHDENAEAIASGDKFFQRHAAILGSTGSGKSWAVALLLEKAAQLQFPNIIVFDMHGEYKPLTEEIPQKIHCFCPIGCSIVQKCCLSS